MGKTQIWKIWPENVVAAQVVLELDVEFLKIPANRPEVVRTDQPMQRKADSRGDISWGWHEHSGVGGSRISRLTSRNSSTLWLARGGGGGARQFCPNEADTCFSIYPFQYHRGSHFQLKQSALKKLPTEASCPPVSAIGNGRRPRNFLPALKVRY